VFLIFSGRDYQNELFDVPDSLMSRIPTDSHAYDDEVCGWTNTSGVLNKIGGRPLVHYYEMGGTSQVKDPATGKNADPHTGTWLKTYNDPELYKWLLQQKRK
jgi:predicted peptidase